MITEGNLRAGIASFQTAIGKPEAYRKGYGKAVVNVEKPKSIRTYRSGLPPEEIELIFASARLTIS